VCSGAGRHAGVIGREGNQPAPGGQDVFSGLRKDCAGEAGWVAASQKKILAVRGERSERPVALPTAPARLNKPEYTTGPAVGDAPDGTRGHGPHQWTRLPGMSLCLPGNRAFLLVYRPPLRRARPGFATSRVPPRSARWPWAYPSP
jgi:hypothetical protein